MRTGLDVGPPPTPIFTTPGAQQNLQYERQTGVESSHSATGLQDEVGTALIHVIGHDLHSESLYDGDDEIDEHEYALNDPKDTQSTESRSENRNELHGVTPSSRWLEAKISVVTMSPNLGKDLSIGCLDALRANTPFIV